MHEFPGFISQLFEVVELHGFHLPYQGDKRRAALLPVYTVTHRLQNPKILCYQKIMIAVKSSQQSLLDKVLQPININ
jgi:hypothetical protein